MAGKAKGSPMTEQLRREMLKAFEEASESLNLAVADILPTLEGHIQKAQDELNKANELIANLKAKISPSNPV